MAQEQRAPLPTIQSMVLLISTGRENHWYSVHAIYARVASQMMTVMMPPASFAGVGFCGKKFQVQAYPLSEALVVATGRVRLPQPPPPRLPPFLGAPCVI